MTRLEKAEARTEEYRREVERRDEMIAAGDAREQELRHLLVAIGVKAAEDGNETIRGMVSEGLWGRPIAPAGLSQDPGRTIVKQS